LHQTYRGVALADRLSQIAALFNAGLISDQLVRTIVYRTALITDPEAMAAVDAELADFVRCRDLTCRWPGCDKPAYGCDLDHAVPYPVGPTHASNLKCLCRFQQRQARSTKPSSSRWPTIAVSPNRTCSWNAMAHIRPAK
jgi:hypothetical protein